MHIPKKVLGIIPARFASTRFPGKPLVMMGEKSMIQRVYEQASKASSLTKVVVATDDERIFDHVLSFGGYAVQTAVHHISGTDRCAEVAAMLPDFDYVVNIQGDEPFINPSQIDLVASALAENAAPIATLAVCISDKERLENPNIVKLVLDNQQNALYFSRSPIPYPRTGGVEQALLQSVYLQHIGIYGFERKTLLELTKLAPSRLELLESLEQLRWLENGFGIAVRITDTHHPGIDTPEDMQRALAHLSPTQV